MMILTAKLDARSGPPVRTQLQYSREAKEIMRWMGYEPIVFMGKDIGGELMVITKCFDEGDPKTNGLGYSQGITLVEVMIWLRKKHHHCHSRSRGGTPCSSMLSRMFEYGILHPASASY